MLSLKKKKRLSFRFCANLHLLANSGGGRPVGWSLIVGAVALGKAGAQEALADWAAEGPAGHGAGGFQSMKGLKLGSMPTGHLDWGKK